VCHHRYPDRIGLHDPYAAAGSEIRVGDWRGRRVAVCRTDGRKCIVVTLVDWCACKGNRIIDLYYDAFDALNVRGETGGIRVKVRW